MDFEEGLALTQERLADEADSFAEVLERLRTLIPAELIGEKEWQELLERARPMPATIGAFPFGFELPLHERRPAADLGISVVGGTGPGTFFEETGQSDNADPSSEGIARLLRETEPDKSPLREIVGRKMMLEYDVASAVMDLPPEPGIFLRPAERPIVGGSNRLRDVGVVLDALVSAIGWTQDAAERRLAEQVFEAQTPDTRIDSFGAFPSRERAIRMAVTGFRNSRDVAEFLARAGWPGKRSEAISTVSLFEEPERFASLGVHLDVHADGLGRTLGLSFLAKERVAKDSRYWLDDPRLWTPFIGVLEEKGLAVREKLAALSRWSPGPTTLFGASGPFVLLRGIHHFKLVLARERIEQVKCYPFMVLLAAPSS